MIGLASEAAVIAAARPHLIRLVQGAEEMASQEATTGFAPEAEKRCWDCGRTKPLTEFYRRTTAKDGRQGHCKECSRAYALRNKDAYLKAGARWRERNRHRLPEMRRAKPSFATSIQTGYTRKYRRGHRAEVNRKQRNRRALDPAKGRARDKVKHALKIGTLEKGPCEVCGQVDPVHAHHDDYCQPLNVRWLCPKCHAGVHNA